MLGYLDITVMVYFRVYIYILCCEDLKDHAVCLGASKPQYSSEAPQGHLPVLSSFRPRQTKQKA